MKIKKSLKFISIFGSISLLTLSLSPVIVSCSTTNNDDSTIPDHNDNNSNPILSEISLGGYISNGSLNVNQYKAVIEKANLKEYSRLSLLNINDINTKIKNAFKNLSLEIVKGDEQTGTISFKLIGEYKGVKIPDKTIITVSGFITPEKISNQNLILNINSNLYFENMQNEQNIKNADYPWLEKYIDPKTWEIDIDGKQESLIKYLTDTWQVKDYKYNNNKITANISLKSFESKNWTPRPTSTPISIKISTISIPSNDDLLTYLNNNYVIFKDTAKEYYPSYFYGLKISVGEETTGNILEFKPEFTNGKDLEFAKKYFGVQQLSDAVDFKINLSDIIVPNDIDGSLKFSSYLNFKNNNSEFKEWNEQTKKLPKLEHQTIWEKVIIDKNSSPVSNQIIQIIKKEYPNINSLKEALKDKESIPIEKIKWNYNSFYSFEWEITSSAFVNAQQYFKNLTDTPKIFTNNPSNKSFYNLISKKGLYDLSGGIPTKSKSKFFIDNVYIEAKKSATLQMINNQLIYNLPLDITYKLYGDELYTFELNYRSVFSNDNIIYS